MHFKLLYTKVFNFNTTKVGGATEQPYWNCIRRELSPSTKWTTAQLICTEHRVAITDDKKVALPLPWLTSTELSALPNQTPETQHFGTVGEHKNKAKQAMLMMCGLFTPLLRIQS